MNTVEQVGIQCPYCWESITLLVDCSVDEQEYTEDCQVCCKPNVLRIEWDEWQEAYQIESELES